MASLRALVAAVLHTARIPAQIAALLDCVDLPVPAPANLSELRTALEGAAADLVASVPVPGLLGAALPPGCSVDLSAAIDGDRLTITATITHQAIPLIAGVSLQAGEIAVEMVIAGDATAHLRLARATIAITPEPVPLPFGGAIALGQGVIDADGVRFSEAAITLPPMPLLGDHTLPGSVGFGGSGGTTGSFEIDEPVDVGGLPGAQLTGRLTLDDPTGTGLLAVVPTAGVVSLRVPLAGRDLLGLGAEPMGPQAIVATLQWSRQPQQALPAISLELTGDGEKPAGLVRFAGSDVPTRVAATAGVLATALTAAAGGVSTPQLAALLGAAGVIGATFASSGEVVLSSARVVDLDSGELEIDLTAAVQAGPLRLGPVTIRMEAGSPMRVRWRGVRVRLAGSGPASAIPIIDLAAARLDVVDPGGWRIDSPMDLLQVVGTRSGSGSTWIEVDLRFALDLGPVKVSGATVRATFGSGTPSLELRGLDVQLNLPGVISARGAATITETGLDMLLSATVVPIQLGVMASFSTDVTDGVRTTKIGFAADLPGPIPLGPTGLGLFGVAGSFATNAAMPPLDPVDPAPGLLGWAPWTDPVIPDSGGLVIGAGAVIGTAADLATTFSAAGVLGIGVPDLALRIGLSGRFLQGRHMLSEINGLKNPPAAGLSFLGGLSVDADAFVLALRGSYRIPVLLDIDVPIAMRFPWHGPDWWIHFGTDGHVDADPLKSRPPGPMRATVLPGILDIGGEAYIMIRGNGIPGLQMGERTIDLDGFAVAAGVRATMTLGAAPVLYASVEGGIAAAIGTRPFVVAASGFVRGKVHAGPFSVGASAAIDIQSGPGDYFLFKAKLCGEVDLLLTSFEVCVAIESVDGSKSVPDLSDDEWPFPTPFLADGMGRMLPEGPPVDDATEALQAAPLAAGAPQLGASPVVWPDVIPMLSFPVAPLCAAGVTPAVNPAHAGTTGTERTTYTWTLDQVALDEIDAHGAVISSVPLSQSSWQLAEGVDPATVTTSTSRILALLTSFAGTTSRARGDAPPQDQNPPAQLIDSCRWSPKLRDGWCLGCDATPDNPVGTRPLSWLLPVERRGWLAPPASSLWIEGAVAVHVEHRVNGGGSDASITSSGGPRHFAGPVEDYARSFAGALSLPKPLFFSEQEQTVAVRPLMPLRELEVVASIDAEWQRSVSASVTDDAAGVRTVQVESLGQLADGRMLLRIAADGQSLSELTITSRANATLEILGVRTLSGAAADRAAQAAQDAADVSGQNAAASASPGAHRQLLAPGSIYRITTTLSVVRTSNDPDIGTKAYPPQSRSWVFRTAPRPSTPTPGAPTTSSSVTPAWESVAAQLPIQTSRLRRDTFEPSYLERYLIGYDPGDHVEAWYADDPLAAEFEAGHLLALAAAYGRDLVVTCRRLDRPASRIKRLRITTLQPAITQTSWIDRALAQAADAPGACPQPLEGGRAEAALPLDLRAPYEVRVALPETGKAATAHTAGLHPIVITTSRWRTPLAQLRACGFSGLVTGRVHGHLIIGSPLQSTSGTGDLAFEDALRTAGLPALRAVDQPRLSALWIDGATPRLAGVLLESPEPIDRPGRVQITGLTIASAGALGTTRDTSGSRWLWSLPQPMPVATSRRMRLTYQVPGSAARTAQSLLEPLPEGLLP